MGEYGVPPSAFRVRVIPNPKHPDAEEHAERARRAIDAALTAAGYPDHPPRRLRLVRGGVPNERDGLSPRADTEAG